MIAEMINKFGTLPRANKWLIHFEAKPKLSRAVENLNNSIFFCQSIDLHGRNVMTKETFGLTQPQSYGYATSVGDLGVTFLVSAGTGSEKSTYDTFLDWMDYCVSTGFANQTYSDDNVCNVRVKLLDENKIDEAQDQTWHSGGKSKLRNPSQEHLSFYITRAWPSAISNLSLTMDEAVLTFNVTFKIHKILGSSAQVSGAAESLRLSKLAGQLTKAQLPSNEILEAINQNNEVGRSAVAAFNKVSSAAETEGVFKTTKPGT